MLDETRAFIALVRKANDVEIDQAKNLLKTLQRVLTSKIGSDKPYLDSSATLLPEAKTYLDQIDSLGDFIFSHKKTIDEADPDEMLALAMIKGNVNGRIYLNQAAFNQVQKWQEAWGVDTPQKTVRAIIYLLCRNDQDHG